MILIQLLQHPRKETKKKRYFEQLSLLFFPRSNLEFQFAYASLESLLYIFMLKSLIELQRPSGTRCPYHHRF